MDWVAAGGGTRKSMEQSEPGIGPESPRVQNWLGNSNIGTEPHGEGGFVQRASR